MVPREIKFGNSCSNLSVLLIYSVLKLPSFLFCGTLYFRLRSVRDLINQGWHSQQIPKRILKFLTLSEIGSKSQDQTKRIVENFRVVHCLLFIIRSLLTVHAVTLGWCFALNGLLVRGSEGTLHRTLWCC